MNNSGTSTEANGKDLKGRKELNVSRENIDNLLEDYFEILREEGYGRIHLDCMSFDVPEVSIKDRVGDENEATVGLEIQNVDPKTTGLLKKVDEHTKLSMLPEKTEKNAKAYDKTREKARQESKDRAEAANKKAEQEKKAANKQNQSRDSR